MSCAPWYVIAILLYDAAALGFLLACWLTGNMRSGVYTVRRKS